MTMLQELISNNVVFVALPLLLAVLALAIYSISSGRRNQTLSRLSQMAEFRDEEKARVLGIEAVGEVEEDKNLGTTIYGIYREIIEPLPIFGKKDQDKIARQLKRAGIRSSEAVGVFISAKLAISTIGALISLLVMLSFGLFEGQSVLQLIVVLGSFVLTGIIPDVVLSRMATSRQDRLITALPDALDLMVICAEAGLSLDVTIERVGREIEMAAPDLSRELIATSDDLKINKDRTQALDDFADRADVQPVKSLVGTLRQTLKYGTSLGHSLRVLADETRNTRMLRIEEKAARLPALMSLPIILFILPCVFIIVAGPAMLEVMKIMPS